MILANFTTSTYMLDCTLLLIFYNPKSVGIDTQ